MKAVENGRDPYGELILLVSRAAAVISLVIGLGFRHFSTKTHEALFSEYEEDIIELATGRDVSDLGQVPDSYRKTTISCAILLLLAVAIGDNVAMAISGF